MRERERERERGKRMNKKRAKICFKKAKSSFGQKVEFALKSFFL